MSMSQTLKQKLVALLNDDTFQRINALECDFKEALDWQGKWRDRAIQLETYLDEMIGWSEGASLTAHEEKVISEAKEFINTTVTGTYIDRRQA